MANSIVKVTDVADDMINDSLLLLVNEDGTVTPDRRTVEDYLSSKSGPTKLQIMHIDKSDSKSIDVIVDNVTYMPDNMEVINEEDVIEKDTAISMDEVARNLYNFKLDHDYTPLTSPKPSPQSEEDDELAKTLSILHGNESPGEKDTTPIVITVPPKINKNINIISSITIPPTTDLSSSPGTSGTVIKNDESVNEMSTPKMKGKAKMLNTQSSKPLKNKNSQDVNKKVKVVSKKDFNELEEEEEKTELDDNEEESEEEIGFDPEIEDDDDDSDFDIQEELGVKKGKRGVKHGKIEKKRSKRLSQSSTTSKLPKSTKKKKELKDEGLKEADSVASKSENKNEKVKTKEKSTEKPTEQETKEVDSTDLKSPEVKTEDAKTAEKKHKKKKEPPKPIPGDFALFSTPDIIRKVGGKEPTTPGTGEQVSTPQKPVKINPEHGKTPGKTESAISPKPAKITQESRSKSTSESSNSQTSKHNRHSLDSKEKHNHHKTSNDHKNKERRDSLDKAKHSKSSDEKTSKSEHSHERRNSEVNSEKREAVSSVDRRLSESSSDSKSLDSTKSVSKTNQTAIKSEQSTPKNTYAQQLRENEPVPSAEDIRAIIMNEDTKTYTTNTIPIPDTPVSVTHPLDANNLTLDGTGLDLDQTILDNINNDMISEDILYQVAQQLVSNTELQNAIDKGINEGVLDTSGLQDSMDISQVNDSFSETPKHDIIKEGTQIVRPDGRVLVLPPIERPTTRSRNKRKEDSKPSFKTVHKPLDDEHVSGNELDSSDENEEESEDDPNKLWCICNQPHNNRFMICCDTCEEWYHGKCVNITKAMGQQMESEGKEWICLFCKDPALKRPMAAARRIRRASRNSRLSSDSSNSATKVEKEKSSSSVPCVVCQKAARKNSIYCSESCILTHAQGIEKVVVFERSTGNMLTGNNAPNATNLDQWLKEHPGYEVVRSAGKLVTTKVKSGNFTQSKLKFIKNPNNDGVSLAVQQKGVNIGVLKHAPKHISQPGQQQLETPKTVKVIKIYHKDPTNKESRIKLIQAQPLPQSTRLGQQTPPTKPKVTVQTTLTPKGPTTPTIKTPKKDPLKDSKPKTPKTKQKEEAPQPKKEDIRENVQKTVAEQLGVRLKGSDIKLTEEEVKNISTEIEAELYKCFGDTGHKYKNKYRSLIFNIKDSKNQTLWRRICEKSISSYELVRLSPDDMASQELAKWREQEAKHQLDMIKKNEIELLNCNRQYVLKTHKGEEVLEDNRPGNKIDNTEIIKSLTEGSTLHVGEDDKKHSSKEKDKDRDKRGSAKHAHKDKNREKDRHSSKERKDRDKEHRSRRSSSRDKDRSRKRSRSKDRSRHEKKKDKRSRSKSKERERSRERDKSRDRHRKSHKSSRHKKGNLISSTDNLGTKAKEILEKLNKIAPPFEDKLWKHVPQEDLTPGNAPVDSDSDHEIPSSTVTIPTPPRSQESDEFQTQISQSSNDSKSSSKNREVAVLEERGLSPPPKQLPSQIWMGTINMVDVAQISITAHEVSGDCTGLNKELSENLDIVGRISPETVWDYISKMRCSNSKIISLIRLTATNVEEQMPYLALYSYLSSRNRLGVVKSTNKAIKDFYILPLASQKPIPQALLPINGPGFEEARPALLLGIVVRDKRKRAYTESTPTAAPTPHKKTRVEVTVIQTQPTTQSRSYTPPPVPAEVTPAPAPPLPPLPPKVDPRLAKITPPLPPIVPDTISSSPVQEEDSPMEEPVKPVPISEDDEPYSPEDSDPDTVVTESMDVPSVSVTVSNVTAISMETTTVNEGYATIPGLGDALPSSKMDIQRQMEELNKQIELQKSEITSITKNIATAGSEIAGSALASIALPSNLQQILDSIKTIATEEKATPVPQAAGQTDLTIPLIIPKTFTRPLCSSPMPDVNSDTIPLNLPIKPKIKPSSVNSPLNDGREKSTSVLGSLTEEDLIKKAAAEMMDEDRDKKSSNKNTVAAPSPSSTPKTTSTPLDADVTLPPVPGVD
ncbi:death-inducer obliterator 1 isoform X2 [Sitophilus oryzae]|uniref:Death-inducer obliterator 1 isoform X2 n=1 Tax=Sitophilus oryzae TaxID=7048 RepID=A0A6J2YQ74_SITOR|nr:death-inducer obliterator 1 isoform X2 [Sitophilus oryzae]